MIDVDALSGYAVDLQNAVNQIQSTGDGLGNVLVPPAPASVGGRWVWNGEKVTFRGGVNFFAKVGTAGCQGYLNNWAVNTPQVILYQGLVRCGSMFSLLGSNGKRSRMSGMQLERKAPTTTGDENYGTGIETDIAKDFRFDHCTFLNWGDSPAFIDADSNGFGVSYGLLDHCYIDNPYKWGNPSMWAWGYGPYSRGDIWGSGSNIDKWLSDVSRYAGHYSDPPPATTIMYVENSLIRFCRHAADGINGSWNCYRANFAEYNVPNYGQFETHGTSDGGYVSARGYEAYNNLVREARATLAEGAFRVRGGSCFIYNNQFIKTPADSYSFLIKLDDSERSTSWLPQTKGSKMYIWDNSYTGSSFLSNPDRYVENVDYFLRSPSQAQDGITYVPYPFPHPQSLEDDIRQYRLTVNSSIGGIPFVLRRL